jgi:uncharacterized repeat protein (TIGR01451 family)
MKHNNAGLQFLRRHVPRVILCAVALAGAAWTPAAAAWVPDAAGRVDEVRLCETGLNCDGPDARFQVNAGDFGQHFGFAMATGYINGDPYADLVIGAPEFNGSRGRIYIYFGGAQRALIPPQGQTNREVADTLNTVRADVVIEGPASGVGPQFGFSVAVSPRSSAGDTSNEILVGAPAIGTGKGAAYLIQAVGSLCTTPCTRTLETTPNLVTLNGQNTGEEAGYSVAIGPALNADSADDLVVGARRGLDNSVPARQTGRVYVVDGIAVIGGGTITVDLSSASVGKIVGSALNQGLGESLTVAAFVDANPPFEIGIGAVGTQPSDTSNGRGRVFVVTMPGAATVNLATAGAFRVQGGSGNDFFGFSLAAGDFDDNGAPDLAVGAIYADRPVGTCGSTSLQKNSGALYVFDNAAINGLPTAEPGGLAGTAATHFFWGHRQWDEMGFAVSAGDVNGDGVADLAASAPRHERGLTLATQVDEGMVYVFQGGGPAFTGAQQKCLDCDTLCHSVPDVAALLIGSTTFGVTGSPNRSDNAGFSMAIGDFNGDALNPTPGRSFDDILVSSIQQERAYLVTLQNTDEPPGTRTGQEIDLPSALYRDLRDEDDDGDGYGDLEEDLDNDGIFETGEPDPLVPNTDVAIESTPAVSATVTCDGTITVAVRVRNTGRKLAVFDPQLQIALPGPPFAYVPCTTAITGGGAVLDTGGCPGVFPFLAPRSITVGGAEIDPGGFIEVTFQITRVAARLGLGAAPTGDVDASVTLPPAEEELLFTTAPGNLAQKNDLDNLTITMLRPDLQITKASLDVNAGAFLHEDDILRYTVVISNVSSPPSGLAATNVTLQDVIPASTTYEAGTESISPGNVITGGSTVNATIPTIPIGGSVTATFDVKVNAATPNLTVLTNQATITETCLANRLSNPTTDQVQRKGTIVIVEVTNPDDPEDFTFASNIPGNTAFTLDDDGEVTTLSDTKTILSVIPGVYAVTENPPSTVFVLTSLNCTDGTGGTTTNVLGRQVSIDVAPNETVTCTFTNTKQAQLRIEKLTLPDGDATDFTFTPTNWNGNATFTRHDNEAAFASGILTPGGTNYDAVETVPAGYALTGRACVLTGTATVKAFTPITDGIRVNLSPGEDVTCTFTDTKLGSITVIKDSLPDDPQDFGFTTTGLTPAAFDLDDDGNNANTLSNTRTFASLLPGVFAVAETAVSGWTTAATCTGDDDGTNPATIQLDPGENVTCTFTNTKLGSITVIKDSLPDDPQVFGFTTTGLTPATFDLDDDGNNANALSNTRTFSNLSPGAYAVAETAVSGWTTAATCTGDDDGTNPATIQLDPGENVVCTFTNTKLGSISIIKVTDPQDGQDFGFTAPGLTPAAFDLDDDGNNGNALSNQQDFMDVVPGSFTVAEDDPTGDGFTLVGLSCSDPDGGTTTDVNARVATIDLDPGENITCMFTNVPTAQASITIVEDAQPNDPQDFSFTFTAPGPTDTNFDLDDDADPTLSNTRVFTGLTAAATSYSVTQTALGGWAVALSCIGDDDWSSLTPNDITLDANEHVVCAFTNTSGSLTGGGTSIRVDGTRVAWSRTPDTVRYNLYRGSQSVLRATGQYTQDPASVDGAARFCGISDLQTSDGYVPPVGQVVFYMVTSDNGMAEGTLGETSAGVPRPNHHPCGVIQGTPQQSPRRTR